MATVELVEEAPSLFDVPPDHGPLASVPPGEAFHLQEQADLVSRINNVLRDAPVLASGPINPLSDAVLDAIAGGELLPHLLNAGAPDSIDLRALNSAPPDDSIGDSFQPLAKAELPASSATVPTEPFVARSVAASPPGGVFAIGELGAASPLPSSLSPELARENHTLLVNAAASVGSAVPQIHETQLLYAPQHKQVALHQAYNIIKHGLLSKINAQALPHLAALLEDGEKPGQVPPEVLLARWINKTVDNYLQQHPQDRRRLPTDHIVNDALDGDITAQLAMALHQVAKEPLFSIGSTILPTVPIVPEAIENAPLQSGVWGQHGAKDPVALGSAAAPTQPVAPQRAGVAPPSSWPVESSQAAQERLLTSAGGAGGMAVPRGIDPGLTHLTNDPSLVHSSANVPTVSSVPAVAPGPVAAGDASSSGWAHDPLASTLERGLPTTAFVPQLAAGAAGDAPAGGEGHGSSALAMPLQQAIVPTTVQMPLAAAHAGEGLPETFWRASPGARAKQVIDHAVAAGGPKIFAVAPSDLTEPRPRMQQCFVASVVDALGAGGGEEGELDTYEEETNDSAEARVFKNWAASLGLKLNMKDLYADSCSGIVLLKVMDRLEPGAVDWGRVEGTPKNKYETVANCNYAVKVAKELGLKLTGISGQDISEGKEKLMLAVWWQLMRKDFMQFLDDLDMDQAFVLSWANAQVARSADIQLSRFGDPAIKSGVFLLQLMRAVAPKAIKADLIRPGHSELDRQLNAKLAISTAHKMGARVFCGWQDILEARPKLMLSMVAAIMSVYLKTNDLSKDDVLREVRRGSVALDSMRASQRGSSESLGERTASTLAGKLAQAWARPHVAPRARLNEAEASKVLAWSKPHAIIESVRRNLEEDRLEDPGKSKAAQIRERASATPRAERGTVKRSEMSKSFATKVKRAKALAVTSRPFAPGLDPMPSARVAIAVDIPPAVGLPAGEPPLPTARGGAPLQPAEKPPVQDAFVVSLEI